MAQAATGQPRFAALVSALDAALVDDPQAPLDAARHPEVYQLAAEAGIAALQSFPAGGASDNAYVTSRGPPPTVVNGPGDQVIFVNPRTVYYCAGVFRGAYAARPPDEIISLEAKPGFASVRLTWPPIVRVEPTETPYALGNGRFFVRIESGTRAFDIGRMFAATPEGCAFVSNALKGVISIVDLVVGIDLVGNKVLFSTDGLARFKLTVANGWEIFTFLRERKIADAFTALLTFVEEQGQSIGLYLTEMGLQGVSSQFMSSVAGIAKKVSIAFTIVGAANEQIPFLYDWIFAPPLVDYCLDKAAAAATSCGTNAAPLAVATVTPRTGDLSTLFALDASGTTDDTDPPSALEVRWDFDGDGAWDTDWSTNKRVTHRYAQRNSYSVFMEARDLIGASSLGRTVVNVSGGFASGRHVIIFRDVLPWQNVRIEELLTAAGITAGPGVNQFEVLPSSEMTTRQLIPRESFVIIGNSQNQLFYDRYSANNVRFANFVYNGGAMFWEACDKGWFNGSQSNAGGDMRRAGVIIPGNVNTVERFDEFNYLTDTSLPLVSGLPAVIQHNYASHVWFTELTEGTTAYMVNSINAPTLIEYKYGEGWVLATGQPIEHGYYYGRNLGLLLPRVVSYVLGRQANAIIPALAQQSAPPSLDSLPSSRTKH